MRFRASAIALTMAVTAYATIRFSGVIHPDSRIADAARDDLFSVNALQTFALHGRAQMGPLAIALSALPESVYRAVTVALLLPVLLAITAGAEMARRPWLLGLRCLLVALPWADLAWKGHIDDALVIVCAVTMALIYRRHKNVAVAVFAISIAAKPTALVLAPILITTTTGALGGLMAALAIWGPFFLANPAGMLSAGKGVMQVVPGDLLHYMGVSEGPPPPWLRPAQLASSLLAAFIGLLRRRVFEGLMLAFAGKALLEANPAPAYSIPLVVLALVAERNNRLPVMTLAASASFFVSDWALRSGHGIPRLAILIFIMIISAAALIRDHNVPFPQSKPSRGESSDELSHQLV